MTMPMTMLLTLLLSTFCCLISLLHSAAHEVIAFFLTRFLTPTPSSHMPPLPPGTMGWPYLGETSQLYSSNPHNFFTLKQRLYGSIFKSHILGCPSVMVSSPEAVRFVLVGLSAEMFRPTFPASKERMLGRKAISFQSGEYHLRLRRIVQRAFMPESLARKVGDIESVATQALRSWVGGGPSNIGDINTYKEMKTYTFHVALLYIFGADKLSLSYVEELKQHYYTLEKAYNSMPINLPGTLFHKGMKARERLVTAVGRIVASRRQRGVVEEAAGDLLGALMDSREALTDEQLVDNVICVVFAARDTTASVLTWIVKYLGENPDYLRDVTEEQEKIKRMKRQEAPLTWADTRKMVVTLRVIQETLRLASTLSFTFREALEDVEYGGFLIPKGWKVMPLFRNIHHNPDFFPDPEEFDPLRFEVPPKPNTFIPFGNGNHSCPGNELAKLEMLILLHHLTTEYRWSLPETDNRSQFSPFAIPRNGLPIRIFPRDGKQ